MECKEIKKLTIDDLRKHLGKKLPEECIGFVEEPLDECDLFIIVLCMVYNQNKNKTTDRIKKIESKQKILEIIKNIEDKKKDKKETIDDILKKVVFILDLYDSLNSLLDILFDLFLLVDVSLLEKIFVFIMIDCLKNNKLENTMQKTIHDFFDKTKKLYEIESDEKYINKTKETFKEEARKDVAKKITEYIRELGDK